eukprot:18566-Heterococcus_DN1.PRE.1
MKQYRLAVALRNLQSQAAVYCACMTMSVLPRQRGAQHRFVLSVAPLHPKRTAITSRMSMCAATQQVAMDRAYVVTANCDATTATAASTNTLLQLSQPQVFSELVPQGSGQLIMLTRAEKEDKDSDNSDSDAPQDEMTASSSVPQNVSISAYIAASMCYSEWSA